MGISFSKLFEQLLKEVDTKNIGIFPGKFKPPHAGHYKTCEVASKKNDIVVVLISQKEHEGITAEKSFAIWNIYKKYLPNIFPFIATPTPVLACYDLANIINNGQFSPTPRSQKPSSNIQEFIDGNKEISSFINVGNNANLNLYSSPEDRERFKRLNSSTYKGKNIINIRLKPVARVTSATQMRASMKNKEDISSYLPQVLSSEDKSKILNIINDRV